jgi:sporulation protein YlmC with PRC-barrel domain
MNVKELVGMTVFAIDGGLNAGTVERLLFSPEEMRVTDLVVTRGTAMLEEPEPQRVLPTDRIKAIGRDAITIESEDVLDVTPDGEVPAGRVAFDEIEREKVITESGDQIGEVSSISFSDTDYRLTSIEVSRGFLSGSALIPVSQVVSVGEDVIVVRDTALDTRDEDAEEHRLFREIDETGDADADADNRDTALS